nr:hypothetical protein [uncultured Brevibacillus sp.]
MRLSPKLTEKDLKYDLSQKEIAYLEEHLSDLPGVSVITKPIRVYDPKEVAVQAIGYVRPYHVAENLGVNVKQIRQRSSNYHAKLLPRFWLRRPNRYRFAR